MKQPGKLQGIFAIYTLGLILGSLMPGSGVSVGQLDKIGHFAAYLGLAVLFFLVFKPGQARILALLSAVLLGAVLEWGQSFVPGRDTSLFDGMANTLGVITGIGLYRYCGQHISRMVDKLIK